MVNNDIPILVSPIDLALNYLIQLGNLNAGLVIPVVPILNDYNPQR
jgi:hypothetical protein